MANSYTHYWDEVSCYFSKQSHLSEPLDHTAGNLFRARGVQRGDRVYIVTVIKGKLYLIGRLEVGQIVDQAEAARILPYEPYQADDHLIARPGTATSHDFDRQVSDDITASLRFFSGPKKLPTPLKFVTSGRLDQQTLRGVRQLTPDSAAEFEKILNAPVTV